MYINVLTSSSCFVERDNEDLVSLGWQSRVHPEGDPYFYYSRPKWLTYTNMNVGDSRIRDTVQYYATMLYNDPRARSKTEFHINCTIHLELDEDTGAYNCFYYLVHHGEKVVFWVHEFAAIDILGGTGSCTALSHIGEWSL
jgi:hypothetical protein